jgi:hypothetical protein
MMYEFFIGIWFYTFMEDKMKSIKYILATLITFVLLGCEGVFISRPMGEKVVLLKARDWDGSWLREDGFLKTKVLDGEKGKLIAAWIENAGEGFKLVCDTIYIRKTGERMFWNKKEKYWSIGGDGGSQTDNYLWGKIKRNGRQVILWKADIETFKGLVNEGKLPGRVDKDGSVFLDDLSQVHLKIFLSEKERALYDWNEPFVLNRISP